MISQKVLHSLYLMIVLAFFNIFNSGLYNNLFEFFLLLLALLNMRKFNNKLFSLVFIVFCYVLLSLIYAVILKNANILDFLLIYKFFIYLFLLPLLVGKNLVTFGDFNNFYKFLIWAFLLKYVISFFVFGDTRPFLFYENNYELMFLSLLFYLSYILKGRASALEQVVLTVIFALSGSKSGLLIISFVLCAVNYRLLYKKAHIIIPSTIALIIMVVIIFKERMGGSFNLERIDRFRFLLVFIKEIKEWSIFNYLFGTERISALSNYACSKLGYYQSLFSYKGDGSCYSVIFHSYILRAIYDHGILGLLFMCYSIYKLLLTSGFYVKHILVVLGIALLNGLSVSSFNSIYFIWGIAFYFIVYNASSSSNIKYGSYVKD